MTAITKWSRQRGRIASNNWSGKSLWSAQHVFFCHFADDSAGNGSTSRRARQESCTRYQHKPGSVTVSPICVTLPKWHLRLFLLRCLDVLSLVALYYIRIDRSVVLSRRVIHFCAHHCGRRAGVWWLVSCNEELGNPRSASSSCRRTHGLYFYIYLVHSLKMLNISL